MLCSARVALVMLTVNKSESENMSAQPDREIQFRTTVINSSVYSGISAAVHLEFVMCIEQIQNQMALQIKLEFIFHFIHKHVCKHTRSRCRGYAV